MYTSCFWNLVTRARWSRNESNGCSNSWVGLLGSHKTDVEKRSNHNKDLGGLEEFLCKTDLTKKRLAKNIQVVTDSAMKQPIMTLSCHGAIVTFEPIDGGFQGHLTAPRWQGSHQCHTSSMTLFKSEAWGCFHFQNEGPKKKRIWKCPVRNIEFRWEFWERFMVSQNPNSHWSSTFLGLQKRSSMYCSCVCTCIWNTDIPGMYINALAWCASNRVLKEWWFTWGILPKWPGFWIVTKMDTCDIIICAYLKKKINMRLFALRCLFVCLFLKTSALTYIPGIYIFQ